METPTPRVEAINQLSIVMFVCGQNGETGGGLTLQSPSTSATYIKMYVLSIKMDVCMHPCAEGEGMK